MFLACNPQPVGNQKEIKEEINNREIKRVTKAEILKESADRGKVIAQTAQAGLSSELIKKLQQEDVTSAITHCNLVALPIMDSLSKANNAEIRRVSHKTRNKDNAPGELEMEILDAYQYAFEQGHPLEENVQEMSEEVILYTKPIILSNPICLNCHGNPGTDIKLEDKEKLDELYPTDSATGYEVGDLRGMWSIRFNKKELIKSMD